MLGMFSFGKKEEEPPKDKNEILVLIFKRVMKKKIHLAEGSGNFARYIQIDKKIYWKYDQKGKQVKFKFETKDEYTLPSSSICREELKLIKDEQFTQA